MLHVDVTIVEQNRHLFDKFKKIKPYEYNFRCPLCGDSKKYLNKTRGYIYRKSNDLLYYCHNGCGGRSLGNLLKAVDESVYDEYVKLKTEEMFKGNDKQDLETAPNIIIKDTSNETSILNSLLRLDALDDNNFVADFLNKRKIPRDKWRRLYYTDKFKTFSNWVVPGSFHNLSNDCPRLIIPYFDENNKMFMFQARTFDDDEVKYYSIKIDDRDKIYGLDMLDKSQHVYIVEGPIDSLFINNSLAVGGAYFNLPLIQELKDRVTIAIDNEPRNKEVIGIYKKTIDMGYSVVIYPSDIEEKDINDMVMAGRSVESIMDIINSNTYKGIEAKIKLNNWRKI